MVREAPYRLGEDDEFVRDERSFEGGPGNPARGRAGPGARLRAHRAAGAGRPPADRAAPGVGGRGRRRRLAEVVDDEVSVLDGRRVAGRFREVEVELAPEADDAVLGALTTRLEAAGGSRSGKGLPKFVRALLPRSLEPPEIVAAETGPESSVRDVIRSSIAPRPNACFATTPGSGWARTPRTCTRRAWPRAGCVRTCGPSRRCWTRAGPFTCGPSWVGTGRSWDGSATSTSCGSGCGVRSGGSRIWMSRRRRSSWSACGPNATPPAPR